MTRMSRVPTYSAQVSGDGVLVLAIANRAEGALNSNATIDGLMFGHANDMLAPVVRERGCSYGG